MQLPFEACDLVGGQFGSLHMHIIRFSNERHN